MPAKKPGSKLFVPVCRVYCIANPVKTYSEILYPISDQEKEKFSIFFFIAVLMQYCDWDERKKFFHFASAFSAIDTPVNLPAEKPAIGVMLY